jgi:hypothetical protein
MDDGYNDWREDMARRSISTPIVVLVIFTVATTGQAIFGIFATMVFQIVEGHFP